MKRSVLQAAIAISLCAPVKGVAQPQDLMQDAGNAFNRGDYREAIRRFETVRAHSADCQIPFYMGLSHYRLRELDAAIVDLATAAKCNPQSVEFNAALAEAFIQKGDDNRALASYENVINLDPGNVAALRAASILYIRHDMSDQALTVLRKLVALDSKDSRAAADLAAAYAAHNQFTEAGQFYEKALALDSHNVSALAGLGNVEFKTGRDQPAIEVLSRAIRLDSRAPEPLILRGRCFTRLKQYPRALVDFKAAIQMGASDPEIFYYLAQTYRAMNRVADSQKALAEYKRLRDLSDSAAESRREAARLSMEARHLVDSRDLPAAVALLERARAMDPQSAPILFRLAGIYFENGQYEKAEAGIQDAIKLAPSQWDFHYLAGLIEIGVAQYDSARRSLETAARLNPSAADPHNQLGDLALRRNDLSTAVEEFGRAVQLAPEDAAYRKRLEDATRLSYPERAKALPKTKNE